MSSAVAVAEERDTLREENRRLLLEKDDLNAKVGELVTRNDELDAKLRELNKKLDLYEEQAAWFKNKLYGRGSEQLTAAELQQIRLFDEIEHAADTAPPEDQAPSDEPPPDQAAAEVLERTRGADRCRRRCRASSGSSTCPSRTSSVNAATAWCASARTPPRSST